MSEKKHCITGHDDLRDTTFTMPHKFLNDIATQALLDNLPAAVLAVQQDGKIVFSNRAAQVLLGYSAREFKQLPDVGIVQDAETLERLKKEIPLHLASKALSTGELLFIAAERFSGTTRKWKCRNKTGHPVHILLTMILLPTTIETTDPLMLFVASSAENADELRNLKTQLLSRVSHEIRTPLHGIIGALELLSSTPVNKEQRELLSLARSKADILLSLINDIFEYTRSNQYLTLTLERTAAEPRIILNNLLEIVSERFAARHIEWTADIDETVPQQVFCDPVRLYQVLLTITSALAMSLQEGIISISTEFLSVHHSPHSNLYFTIRGKAKQTDELKQNQILATLQATEEIADLSPEILQLSLAQTVITALGGFIWGEIKEQDSVREMCLFVFTSVDTEHSEEMPTKVETTLPQNHTEKNTEIRLVHSLSNGSSHLQPLRQTSLSISSDTSSPLLTTTEQQEKTLPQTHTSLSSSSGIPTKSDTKNSQAKQILIVDDDSDNCLLAVQFLRNLPLENDKTIECTIANTGAEAVAAAQKQRFDIILMDIQMPVMDGFEATTHIRTFEQQNKLPRTPIIAVTAHTMEHYRELCLERNMDDYMSKPVKKQPFHEMVKKWLHPTYTLLVTDDSDDYRLLLKLQLDKKQQFSSILATNGQEALELCRKQRIDAILLDMQMPILTGYEAAPLIRQLQGYENIPIWGLTAHEDEQEIQRVLDAGCNRCYTKGSLSVIRHIISELEEHFATSAFPSSALSDAQ